MSRYETHKRSKVRGQLEELVRMFPQLICKEFENINDKVINNTALELFNEQIDTAKIHRSILNVF